MDWTAPVDIYCERLDASFWAEPVNAISNIAFVLAGLIAARAAWRLQRLDWLIFTLCFIACAVGFGSFLFHTVAQRWAGLADVIPIVLFIFLYLLAAVHRFFGLGWMLAVPVTAAAFAAALPARRVAEWLAGGSMNGSENYAPAFLLLAGATLGLAIMGHRAAPRIALATVVFTISLTARTVDASLCQTLTIGTHFLWHLLNGTMIGILLLALVRFGRLPGAKSGDIG